MTVGISGTLGMSGTRVSTVYEDAKHVAREQNILAALVMKKDDRNDDLPRQYNSHPTVSAQTVGEYDDIASATQFNRAAGNTVTPKEEASQVLLTDKRRRAEGESVYSAIAFELGDGLASKVEEDIISTFASFATTYGAAGSPLTWANIFAANAFLNAQSASLRGTRKRLVLHEYQWFDLASAVSLEATLKNTPEFVKEVIARQWYVGTIADIDIFVTSKVDIDASDDATGALFAPQAILLDSRKAPVLEAERDASRRADELNMSTEYGVGLWAPNAGVKIISDAVAPT